MQLSLCPLWPLEIGRHHVSTAGKGGGRGGASKDKEAADSGLSFHAVSYLDLSPLLYPGATSLCGAFPLHTYNHSNVQNKVTHNHCNVQKQGNLQPLQCAEQGLITTPIFYSLRYQ